MATGSLRRSNLVSPFGPGSLTTLVDGTSVLIPGIDAWYMKNGVSEPPLESTLYEPRLQQLLRVGKFVLPPAGYGKNADGTEMTLPAVRFPRWSFCQYCKTLTKSPMTQTSIVRCDGCEKSKGKFDPITAQVPFVVVCTAGHLSDFPWSEWVHKSANPRCRGALRLKSSGTGDLSGQMVSCKDCKAHRNMLGVTESRSDANDLRSNLSEYLDSDGDPFTCSGGRPWLFQEESECSEHIVAVLRSASNVYFSNVASAIFVPEQGELDAQLTDLLSTPLLAPVLNYVVNSQGAQAAAESARAVAPGQFDRWSDEEINDAAAQAFLVSGTVESPDEGQSAEVDREPEWTVLRGMVNHPDLVVRAPKGSSTIEGLGTRRLVPVLKETRALTGFARLQSGSSPDLESSKALLRRTRLIGAADWLPAYVVRGEGVYIELDIAALRAWETSAAVKSRASRLTSRIAISSHPPTTEESTARYFLLHTFAHVLINQMVFTSGYSSAALRERIYSGPEGSGIAGILIYTASGDSDGTLGGLVRLGETDKLRELLSGALQASSWCANDPVCMELGAEGQGPEGCNSSACHSCCLMPETACENFNKGLDRALIVGTLDDPKVGYFGSSN